MRDVPRTGTVALKADRFPLFDGGHKVDSKAVPSLISQSKLAQGASTAELISARLSALTEVYESTMWISGLRYREDFLAHFNLPIIPTGESLHTDTPHVGLRHDCDWSIENAYAMARLEAEAEVRSAYFLLHPDGYVQKQNYFGWIDGNTLIIDPHLFEYAKMFIDLGHEIGLHNDLITLALYLKLDPAILLEQIVASFHSRGIDLKGIVAHGNRLCRTVGYVNYQLFEDCREWSVAPVYRSDAAEHDGFVVEKFKLKMKDFGFEYEANYLSAIHKSVYISDSNAKWMLVDYSRLVADRYIQEGIDDLAQVNQVLAKFDEYVTPMTTKVQCLIHPCHWSPLVNFNAGAIRHLRAVREQRIADRRNLRVSAPAQPENLLSFSTNDKFSTYDASYSANPEHFPVSPSTKKFTDQFFDVHRWETGAIMEIGCGQGTYLDYIRRSAEGKMQELYCLGIDGSATAIRQSAQKYPGCYWIADQIENFLADHAAGKYASHEWMKSFIAVVDKTGATFIRGEEAAKGYFHSIYEALIDGGCYIYIAAKAFYELKARPGIYDKWSSDWMTLAEQRFDRVELFDDELGEGKGYYYRVYWKEPQKSIGKQVEVAK